jgi:hypothetical protein
MAISLLWGTYDLATALLCAVFPALVFIFVSRG